MARKNQFDASSSALGYAYQSRTALYLALQRIRIDPDTEVSIEKIDDIAFEKQGTPEELIQTKHHVARTGSLSDASTDLWKTLRVWAEQLKDGILELPSAVLTIVTTTQASATSAASFLRPTERNPDQALKLFEQTAQSSKSVANKESYKSFMGLRPEQRLLLTESVFVLDQSPSISELTDSLKSELRLTVREEHLVPYLERLEGWWYSKVIEHLSEQKRNSISCRELQDFIYGLADQFKRDSLPIDFVLSMPPEGVANFDETRTFIRQLRLIALSQKSIEFAIIDYYRAFEQRARWVREDLLLTDELTTYEKRLTEEWERFFTRVGEKLSDKNSEPACISAGNQVYDWANNECRLFIRPNCDADFVVRGSFHMLADEQRIGWHPLFVDRLRALLAGNGQSA